MPKVTMGIVTARSGPSLEINVSLEEALGGHASDRMPLVHGFPLLLEERCPPRQKSRVERLIKEKVEPLLT